MLQCAWKTLPSSQRIVCLVQTDPYTTISTVNPIQTQTALHHFTVNPFITDGNGDAG